MSKIPQEGQVLVPVNLTRELGDKMLDAMWPNGDLAHDEAFNGPEQALSAAWSAMIATVPTDAARAQGAEVEPVPLIHMAVSDEDGLRWMTGRKHPNGVAAVELYAMADFGRAPPLYATPPAPQPADREKVLVVEPGDDIAKQQFELWFFRDMSSEQRLKLFGLFGVPIDDKIGQTHCFQRSALRRVLSSLTAPPAPQPTDRERVLEEALLPFAKLAEAYDPDEGDDGDKCWVHEYTPTLGDLRRARAALAGKAPSQTDRAEGGE